jgi:mannose-6-phosphate isomerase-like protein (cupin superfamily)
MSGRAPVKHVPKPWGHETIWALTDRYCGKILHVKAGHALSVQYHERKDETVYLLSAR